MQNEFSFRVGLHRGEFGMRFTAELFAGGSPALDGPFAGAMRAEPDDSLPLFLLLAALSAIDRMQAAAAKVFGFYLA
ncbi:hypothetical protein GCM10011586_03000 [Silvibacterium dinghuense]|nr:hypothetical protein GCM10011586_03000 [Silvibacterium dinghuense]